MDGERLLSISDLVIQYPLKGWRKAPFRAVKGVSFEVERGETVGLVGESGSGKTTIGRSILGLVEPADGQITFDGEDITRAGRRRRRERSRNMQAVFQDPFSSLNPSMLVGDILSEPLLVQGVDGKDAGKRVREVLVQVGLPETAVRRLPREFSGGQRQRVAIARALTMKPKFVVCDEPVSALDMSTQARVLDLLLNIQRETRVAFLFISHDLDVVHHMSHSIVVLKQGQIVEKGSAEQVTRRPRELYTQRLVLASPVPDVTVQAERRASRLNLAESAAQR